MTRVAEPEAQRTPMVGVGVVGTGNVFPAYAEGLAWIGGMPIVRVADVDQEQARRQAERFGIPRHGSAADLYADPDIDVVVNITPPAVHGQVTRDALAAGKHVYSEKPLAATVEAALRNVVQARDAGRVLGAAPDTFLGQAGQTARAAIDDGLIGTPIAATSFVRSSRVETWHPDPRSFYRPGGGPLLDMGPYHLSALVNLLGPIAEVMGATTIPSPRIAVTAPDRVVDVVDVQVPTTSAAVLSTVSGTLVSTFYSFDVWDTMLPHLEVYGTEGTLSLPDPNHHDLPVRIRRRGADDWSVLPPVIDPTCKPEAGLFRGHGVQDLVESLSGRPHRASAQFALHVLEVLEAMEGATFGSGPIAIENTTERPAPRPRRDP
jgi:predicted dehydrogenase